MNADQREEVPDPPPGPSNRAAARARFKRIMARMALVSLLAAIVAVVLVARDPEAPLPVLIATGLGVGLTVLLGTALMSLAFLSSSGGYDEDASGKEKDE